MRAKWAECAGRIIEAGERPKFEDFLKLVKARAKLVNNEFGEDLAASSSREKKRNGEKVEKPLSNLTSMTTKVELDQKANQNGKTSGAN